MSNDHLDSIINIIKANCVELGIEDALIQYVSKQIRKSHQSSSAENFSAILSGRGRKSAKINDDFITALCKCWEVARFTSLDLSYNYISAKGIETLSEKIKGDKYLTKLDLCFNDFEGEGMEQLAKSLHFNKALIHLNLSGCKLGLKGGLSVASMLQVNQSLESLFLSSCDLNTDVLIALATVLSFNQSVLVLDLSRPLLFSKQSETAIHIGRMLKVNKTLIELRLSKHGLTDFDIGELCYLMADNKSLMSLDLSCNKLSIDGAKSLCHLLKYNTTLRNLDLTANRIEDAGLITISDVIKLYNTSLDTLRIGYNNIGDVGLCHLSVSLTRNDTIKSISIWGNKFGVKTCESFSALLQGTTPRFPLDKSYIDVEPYSVDGVVYLAELN